MKLFNVCYPNISNICYNTCMAKRKVKLQGKGDEVAGAGPEKDDNTTSTISDIQSYSTQDDNAKIAGLAAGYREATKTK